MFHKLKIENLGDNRPKNARIYIDDNKVNARSYTLSHYVDEVPQIKLEMSVIPSDIEYQKVVVNVSNKEEIAMAMDKNEFKEFCEIWERINSEEDSSYGSDNK